MLFPNTADVNRVWKRIVQGVVDNRLGCAAKVATDKGNKERLLCIYTPPGLSQRRGHLSRTRRARSHGSLERGTDHLLQARRVHVSGYQKCQCRPVWLASQPVQFPVFDAGGQTASAIGRTVEQAVVAQ